MDALIILIIALAGLWRVRYERRVDRQRDAFEIARRSYGQANVVREG